MAATSIKQTQDEKTRIRIRKYDLRNVQPNSKIFIIGPTNCGKTTLMIDLVYHLRRKIFNGFVISGTEDYNHTYKNIFPDLFIHDVFNDDLLPNLFMRQRELGYYKATHPNHFKRYNIKTETLVVADDILSQPEWKRSVYTKKLFYESRHMGVTLAAIIQDAIGGLDSTFRENVQYVFIFPTVGGTGRDRYWKYYCDGVFPSKEIFNDIYSTIMGNTDRRYCLVIDRLAKGTWQDRVFYYRSQIHEPFVFGSKIMWNFYRDNYIKTYQLKQMANERYKLKTRKHKNKAPPIVLK